MYRLNTVFLFITALASTTAVAEDNEKAEAKALFKKQSDDEVLVETPKGVTTYVILSVSYGDTPE